MEDGVIVGKIFFAVCAFISLLCFSNYKFVARDSWRFIRKYQIKSLNEEPSKTYVKIFRIWTFIVFVVFVVQAIMLGK